MIYKLNNKVVYTNVMRPNLDEGVYPAKITGVQILNDVKTDWGFRQFWEIEYSIRVGITTQKKKERLMFSEAEGSRCMVFLEDFYESEIPQEIILDDFLNRECDVTIKHNTGSNGKVYANIVGRKFKKVGGISDGK